MIKGPPKYDEDVTIQIITPGGRIIEITPTLSEMPTTGDDTKLAEAYARSTGLPVTIRRVIQTTIWPKGEA